MTLNQRGGLRLDDQAATADTVDLTPPACSTQDQQPAAVALHSHF